MVSNGSKVFLLITKLYNSANYATLLSPEKRNSELKTSLHPDSTAAKNREKLTTKQLVKCKFHAN